MIRLFQIMVFSCAVGLLTGCSVPEKDEPIWQQVKIGDLAPSHNGKWPSGQLLKTANFNIYILEIPAKNIDALDDIWRMLHTGPLRFSDYKAFGANSFSVGFGQIQMWDKIRNLLTSADGRTIETVSLLLPDGQANDIPIATLSNEQTIFYISSEGSMEGVTIGPGKLALRIKAEEIPGSRGVCKTGAQPAFSPPRPAPIQQLAVWEKSGQFLFTPAGFRLKMGPGDFFLLGPKKHIDNQITLGGLFFSRPGRKPAVRVYLLVCTAVNY